MNLVGLKERILELEEIGIGGGIKRSWKERVGVDIIKMYCLYV